MLDINWIRANAAAADALLAHRKNVPFSASQLIALDDARKAIIGKLEEAQASRNSLSKQIGQAKAQKDDAKAAQLMDEVAHLKDAIQAGEDERRKADEALRNALLVMPNLPKDEVPPGEDESANVEYFGPNGNAATAATVRPPKPSFSFTPKEHFETGEALGMMDFEAAAKISGSRFVVLKGGLARMERAIGQFMLDMHVDEHGYTEVEPPVLVKDDALYGTNQLPKFEEDLFKIFSPLDNVAASIQAEQRSIAAQSLYFAAIRNAAMKLQGGHLSLLQAFVQSLLNSESSKESRTAVLGAINASGDRQSALISDLLEVVAKQNNQDAEAAQRVQAQIDDLALRRVQNLWLIPTAEVPLTNLVRESIQREEDLPLRFTALTPCFRSEAGSAGRDTRGMLRQHQFNKVELVSITTPEQSTDEHERMLASAEAVLQKLGLHYRVMTLSTGDMGFGAQKTYDIEVWLPGQNAYREISSCSVCGDFQARRMDARFKGQDGKTRHVHTLNGSALAVGRTLIAVMENYQQEDGSIAVPAVLQSYMGGLKTIAARK